MTRRSSNLTRGSARYHAPFYGRGRQQSSGKPAETTTTVTLHAKPTEALERGKVRARRHRDRQAKSRR